MTVQTNPAVDASRPPRFSLRWADVLLPVSLALWAVSLPGVDPDAMTDYGLLAALPITFYLAVALLVVSIAVVATRPALSPVRLGLHLVGLVLVLHATVPYVVTIPNYPWTYKHIGVAEYINRHGALDTSIDIYQNWPGFFAVAAWFTKVAGEPGALAFAAWSPVYFNLLICLELHCIGGALGLAPRTRWLALFLVVPANWVGQDYFAPQALTFVLSLAVFAVVLACLQSDRSVALVRTGLRLARRLTRAGAPAPEAEGPTTRVPSISGPPAAVVVALLAMFAMVVVTHQLSPYMVLAGVGLVSAAGLVRPRWVVVAMLALAVAFLLFRLPYLQTTQDLFGSLFDPFDNVKGNGVSTPPVKWGRRVTAFGAVVMLAWMWGLGMLGVIRRLRAGRPTVALALLAGAPVLLAAGQSYGGEAVFRIYLFSLPWTALLAASALEPARRSIGAGAVRVGAVLAVVVVLFMSATFGAAELYRVRPAELRASEFFYANAQPDSILILGAAQFPSRVAANYDIQRTTSDATLNLLSSTDIFRKRLLGDADVPALNRLAAENAALAAGGVYLALTTSQQTYAEVLGQTPAGSLPNLDRALAESSTWATFFRNADSVIYRFLGDPAGGELEPDPAPPAAPPAPIPPASDPANAVLGVAGLALLGPALRRRQVRRSAHPHTQQEPTMEITVTPPAPAPAPAQPSIDEPSIDDPSADNRVLALRNLGTAPAHVAVLHRVLRQDLSADVRVAAVRALAQASGDDQGPALAVALADPSPAVRAAAAEVLGTGEPAHIEALVAACDDADPGVRRAAYRRLVAVGAPVLWKTMAGSSDRQARRRALGDAGPDELSARALEGAHSQIPEDRVFAVEVAAEAGTPADVSLICIAAGDPDPTVRRVAIAQLRGRVEATDVIVAALDDPEATVRLEAARTLDSVERDDALLALVGRLDDLDPAVRQTCADIVLSRSSAGLARLVAATITASNAYVIEDVLVRMGPVGRQALAARIRHDAEASDWAAAYRAVRKE